MNIVLSECIKRLNEIKRSLVDPPQANESSDGIISANFQLRESIQTRIELIEEIYGDPDSEVSHSNADYALFCMEFTNSLKAVFVKHISECGNSNFDRSYKAQVRKFLEMLGPLQAWLQRISIEGLYNS